MKLPKISGVFFCFLYIYIIKYMDKEGEKKVSDVTIRHWKKKFDKAVSILLQNGIKSESLIDIIKIEENEKNNKNQ